MSKRAEKAARTAYPFVKSKFVHPYGVTVFDGNYDRMEAFQQGYEQAEKDFIERLAKFYPTLDYTFRSYLLQDFPELESKIKNCE